MKSRKVNSMKSIMTSLAYNFIKIIIQFIFRSLFIHYLSITYLGVNSAVASLLNLLSVTELGISSVITFNLYKPVADNDTEKINSIIKFYRNVYIVIGVVILIIGLMCIPFLDILIKDYDSVNVNIRLVYLLSLLSTVVSYFCSYRTVLFIAYQEQYKINLLNTILYIFNVALKISAVTIFKNYYIYLIVVFVTTIIDNILVYLYSKKVYPEVSLKDTKTLSLEDKSQISKNIKGMVYHKLSSVILQATDSIIISSFIGVTILGVYSNYSIFTTNLIMIFSVVCSAMVGSIGNLMVNSEKDKPYEVYKYLKLGCFWFAGFCAICLFVLLNPTITLWAKFSKWDNSINWTLNTFTVFIICLNFYIYSSRIITGTFRECLGMFEKDRFKGIIEAAINLIVSMMLVKPLGIAGILIGTIVSCMCTSIWVDPYMVYKYKFKKSLSKHFIDLIFYTIVTLVAGVLTYYICSLIPHSTFLWYCVKVFVCILIPNIVFLIAYFKTNEFKNIVKIIKGVLKNKKAIKEV